MELNADTDTTDFEQGSAALPDPVPETYEGDNAIDQAVEALERKRADQARQRPQAAEPEAEDPELTRIVWKDEKKAKEAISVRDAAKEYGAYRDQLAADVLAGMQSDFDAQQAAEAEAFSPEAVETAMAESREAQWQQYYESLPVEAKAQVNATVELQQKSALADEWANTHVLALNDLLGRLNGQTTNAFADIRTPEDVARLKATEPARFALLEQQMAAVGAVHAEAQKVRAAHQQQQAALYQQQFSQFAIEEDRKIANIVPELHDNADPEVQHRLKKAALDTLKSVGFTQEELYHGWNGGAPFSLRDSRTQAIIADAAKWRMANSREAKNDLRAKRINAPPPQRPGASVGDHASFSNERAIAERLKKTGSIHDAVALYQSRKGRR